LKRTLVLRGKPVADEIRSSLKEVFANSEATLATYIIGDDPAAHVYKRSLIKCAHGLGVNTRDVELPADISQEEAEAELIKLSEDPTVTGILPLMPVPPQISQMALMNCIDPRKDMDCLHPLNSGEFYLGISPWGPCTPRACMKIIDYYHIPLVGRRVVMVGYGDVVGRPLTLMLVDRHATVTVCRSKTKNLPNILSQADIIFSAVGKPNLITEDMVRENCVLIDIGLSSQDGKLVGDISEGAKLHKAAAYTPVPGGVGVLSNLMVMETLTRNL
jgi:methylenetetrahydrofolate dehydrogenase (NADP+)/methenyltetrahydrofolate cyclohydrolase